MNYYILILVIFALSLAAILYNRTIANNAQKNNLSLLVVLGLVFCMGSLLIFSNTLEQNASYKKVDQVLIFLNEADNEFYIKYQGTVISLKEACPNQYGDYIEKERIKRIPEVNVFEKTYLPKWGLKYKSTKDIVFVHGHDERINHQIQLNN